MLKCQILAVWDDNAGREVCVKLKIFQYTQILTLRRWTQAEDNGLLYGRIYTKTMSQPNNQTFLFTKSSISNKEFPMRQWNTVNWNNLSVVVLMKQFRRKHREWFLIWVQKVNFLSKLKTYIGPV